MIPVSHATGARRLSGVHVVQFHRLDRVRLWQFNDGDMSRLGRFWRAFRGCACIFDCSSGSTLFLPLIPFPLFEVR